MNMNKKILYGLLKNFSFCAIALTTNIVKADPDDVEKIVTAIRNTKDLNFYMLMYGVNIALVPYCIFYNTHTEEGPGNGNKDIINGPNKEASQRIGKAIIESSKLTEDEIVEGIIPAVASYFNIDSVGVRLEFSSTVGEIANDILRAKDLNYFTIMHAINVKLVPHSVYYDTCFVNIGKVTVSVEFKPGYFDGILKGSNAEGSKTIADKIKSSDLTKDEIVNDIVFIVKEYFGLMSPQKPVDANITMVPGVPTTADAIIDAIQNMKFKEEPIGYIEIMSAINIALRPYRVFYDIQTLQLTGKEVPDNFYKNILQGRIGEDGQRIADTIMVSNLAKDDIINKIIPAVQDLFKCMSPLKTLDSGTTQE